MHNESGNCFKNTIGFVRKNLKMSVKLQYANEIFQRGLHSSWYELSYAWSNVTDQQADEETPKNWRTSFAQPYPKMFETRPNKRHKSLLVDQ